MKTDHVPLPKQQSTLNIYLITTGTFGVFSLAIMLVFPYRHKATKGAEKKKVESHQDLADLREKRIQEHQGAVASPESRDQEIHS